MVKMRGEHVEPDFPVTDMVHDDAIKDQELEPPANAKKRSRVSKQKTTSKKKSGAKSKTNSIDVAESSDEGEGNKRGPNWKEHWIINLIHLRGKMHDKFSGIKKRGVDNWGVLHTHLVAACPDFDRSADACRKKWKTIYDTYKADYITNGMSGIAISTKCRYYSLIDGYMHERANGADVLTHVHASAASDEDPNNTQPEGAEDFQDYIAILEPTASTSQLPGKKKTKKLARDHASAMMADQAVKFTVTDAITVMAEQTVKLTNIVRDSEAAKLQVFQGMLAAMNEMVKKL